MCRRVSAARHAIPRGWGNCSGRFARVCALEQTRSEEHTSELQSRLHLVCRLLLEKKNRDDDVELASDLVRINRHWVLPPHVGQPQQLAAHFYLTHGDALRAALQWPQSHAAVLTPH